MIEVWIIDILNLSPINETLDERIEVAQLILKIFDICLLPFCHSQCFTLGLEPRIEGLRGFKGVDQ